MSDTNEVTPVATVQGFSPFHSVSYVDVVISANPDDREVYRQGSVKTNSGYENTFSLSYVALSKLMNAAGIEEVANRRVDDRSHPHFCSWQFSAKWTQPDSTVLAYSGDYELDLRDWIDIGSGQRVMAARFEKVVADERQSIIEKKFPADIGQLKYDAKTAKCDSLFVGLSEDDKRDVTDLAEAKAIRGIVQRRQFIVQLAQTGAMERTIRKMLNLKSQYTASELKKPFRVPRSRFDWDRVDTVLGQGLSLEMRQAQAMKLLGLTSNDLTQARQLAAPVLKSNVTYSQSDDDGEMGGVVAAYDEAKLVETKTLTPAVALIDNWVEESELAPDEFMFRGITRKKNDIVGKSLTDSNDLKTWFMEKVVKGLAPDAHYKAHLKDHFSKESAINLTWEELDLLSRHVVEKLEYPDKYKGKQKKAVKPDKKETLAARAKRLGVDVIFDKTIKGTVFETDSGLAADANQMLVDTCDAVEGGTSNLAEIEQFLKEQFSK